MSLLSVTTTLSKLHDLPEHFGVNKPATEQQYLKHLHVFSNYCENVTISNCCWLFVLPFSCRHWVCCSVCDKAPATWQTLTTSSEPVSVTARALLSLHVLFGHHWRVVQPRKQVAWIPLGVQNASADCGGEIYSCRCRQEARDKLLLEGMNLWGMQVSMLPKKLVLQDQNNKKEREISYQTVGMKCDCPTESGFITKSSKPCSLNLAVKYSLQWEKNLPGTKMKSSVNGKWASSLRLLVSNLVFYARSALAVISGWNIFCHHTLIQ